ncbi:Phosphodiest-domain-containing protein [Thozetella sp. PMI_491]|nr:Phosphodiest-domain-containing protein [Thozetella sp. PMI_491]
MPLTVNTNMRGVGRDHSLLSPSDYDADAASIRSDQESDSDDDERQLRARNSRELRAHDRLVLMEEEETDQLVTETRRQQERHRRGSGLPIPNPLRLFARRYSDTSRSRSRSPGDQPNASSENLVSEKGKRGSRRARRKAKKDRLLAEAKNGEDGELMHEMEEGGMKEGSSTGDSSEREDSDEIDRRGLLQLSDRKSKRTRTLFLHALIVVGFAIVALVAWKLSIGRRNIVHPTMVSNGTALFAPTTLLISLDGFRADFLQRGLTPRLNAFVKEGISPLYMMPSFPSVTFPNHYTLATGLYPESHGVVGNTFWDPTLQAEFYYTDPSRSMDPKWWMGEPFWATAEKQGIRTAIHMWPGSEAHILHIEPSYVDKFNSKEMLSNKVDRIMSFLDKPDHERPQIIAAYVPNVDADGHRYGPNSTEIRVTIQKADEMLDQIFKGLEERSLTNIVNVIIVSDHGMATTDVTRLIQLEDLVDRSRIEHLDGWPLIGLRPKDPNDLQSIYDEVMGKAKNNPNIEVYLRDVNMPERYHFSKNERIAPLWIVPKTGWAIVTKEEMNLPEAQATGAVYHPKGLHGYDHEHPLMRAIFVARGPAFPHQPNSKMEPFQNTEVYNILCDSVGMTPMPNNGTLRLPLRPVGLHSEPGAEAEAPADPVTSYTLASEAPSTPTPEPLTTKPLQVDPVTSAADPTAQSKTIGVDHPDAQPTGAPASGSGEGTEDDKSNLEKVEDAAQNFWDWFTGKVGELWDKVTGHGQKDSEKSSS